jgi:putative hydroxymethylpyrimidine transport system substrate-binding protein
MTARLGALVGAMRGPGRVLAVTAALVLGLAAGCGEDARQGASARQPVELMLDYFPNADHAGIYAAQAGGHFARGGLDVTIRQPPDPAAPLKQVAAGRVDLAISYEPEVLRARDQGLPVVAVAALVQAPLTSVMSLPKAGIDGPADLRGKRVGTAGIDYQSAYLKTILGAAGVAPGAVSERNVGFSLTPALLTGRVDAVLGAFWNYEGTELRLKGRDPRILRMEDVGVPPYDELVIVANERSLSERGGRVRAFLAALERGTADLERDPDGALKGLLEANRELEPRLQREVVKVTLPLFVAPAGKPYGYQDPREWGAFGDWMRERRLVQRGGAEGAFTNDYLPPARGR